MRQRIAEAQFPDSPGVYVVWEGEQAPPLYVGVAATQTIAERWRKRTLQDRAGDSALRRTLGDHLGLVERTPRRGQSAQRCLARRSAPNPSDRRKRSGGKDARSKATIPPGQVREWSPREALTHSPGARGVIDAGS